MAEPAQTPDLDPHQDIIDLSFPVVGQRVPAEHGYALYGAISRRLPQLHGVPWLGIHPLRGPVLLSGLLQISPSTRLVLRLPVTQIPQALGLAGATLSLAGHALRVGAPEVWALKPSSCLASRLVLIRLTDPVRGEGGALDKAALRERFHAALTQQLVQRGAAAQVELTGRYEVRVDGRRLVGFAVRLSGLSDEASLTIQEKGLGGKRAMGCGLFVPIKGGE